ncbi:uncharacterized protein APUU_11901A [Aspergillus puulaauensis]|uniref:Uncharacterized protein n=1 Tax=Aspergillus puulaauensis TaxID=1220207 RepID=A0A7R8AJ20_9EURO|nr:uncharacterized protein APUU_11901A [Aspergillus puulaauensis]BCS19073.1 hypothetical protein APUU_11901A [Aspergillus puulaauensis]
MKIFSTLTSLALISAATAGTIVRWHGCVEGEYKQTITDGSSCAAVSGFLNTNLCRVEVPPPGRDHCTFYTNGCWNPFDGDTYECRAGEACDTRAWKAIASYKCWTE